jgi:serine/threonine protein phosphatase PrpC
MPLSIGELSGAWASDPGLVRGNNEDLAIFEPGLAAYGVIDGVGGQQAGEVAAAIAHTVLRERLLRPLGSPAERVSEAIALANNEIARQADGSRDREGMACVVTFGLVTGHTITLGHVGDSRAYKISPRGLQKLTRDHSPVGEREDAQEITELDAMHHPRRNEVFRELGGAERDKDAEGFVDVIEVPVEHDCALLFCTDGLTDMVPSSVIAHVVRQYAGDTEAVCNALVAAANEAGGRDNVTVVYVEASGFASAIRRAPALPLLLPEVPSVSREERREGVPGDREPRVEALPTRVTDGEAAQSRSVTRVVVGWTIARRATWFAAGMAAGVTVALALVWYLGTIDGNRSRTLLVGGRAEFVSIADAIRAAQPGDVIELLPGTYTERVDLPDGVDLIARVGGQSTIMAPSPSDGTAPIPTAITVAGGSGGRIQGVRIAASENAPLMAGLRVAGGEWAIDGIEIEGPMQAGIDMSGPLTATIRGASFREMRGPAIAVRGASDVTVAGSTFVQNAEAPHPAMTVHDAPRLSLIRNTFVGYGHEILQGVTVDAARQLLHGNLKVAAPEQR